MARISKLMAVFSVLFFISACGTNTKDRVLGGSAVGAGAGLATSVLLNTNPLASVAVGAAAGAITGAAAKPSTINLGKPFWKR